MAATAVALTAALLALRPNRARECRSVSAWTPCSLLEERWLSRGKDLAIGDGAAAIFFLSQVAAAAAPCDQLWRLPSAGRRCPGKSTTDFERRKKKARRSSERGLVLVLFLYIYM